MLFPAPSLWSPTKDKEDDPAARASLPLKLNPDDDDRFIVARGQARDHVRVRSLGRVIWINHKRIILDLLFSLFLTEALNKDK